MALPDTPVVKKFFSNKIESSRSDWYNHLIKIARIFNHFDGQKYDRDELLKHFNAISGRDVHAERDASNFRDEFGAYGNFLGIYHLENIGGEWKIVVSEAAKQFLCTEHPNAGAFCRTQLTLFQYPNGAGGVLNPAGTITVQNNILMDTMRELQNGIHVSMLRLVCRVVVSQVEVKGTPVNTVAIPYDTLFCIVNDDRVNKTFLPDLQLLNTVYTEYSDVKDVNMDLSSLTNFKRNFHIFEKTGLFIRDKNLGLMVSQVNPSIAYDCIKTISNIDVHFESFDDCYENPDEEKVKEIITSPAWARYYDSANLPKETLISLGVELDNAPIPGAPFEDYDFGESEVTELTSIRFHTGIVSKFSRNRILFGAPGTGKSFKLDADRNELLGDNSDGFERVTFHPEYSYSQFIGCYKPITAENGDIRYEFVPGPFIRVLIDALKSGRTATPQPYLLLIEEINRAKVAAVFGEVFQLLDRNDDGYSQYEIHATEDVKRYLAEKLGGKPDDYTSIRIPDNMFIWATMNSADQGVFPMDTAFKRRWDFEYIGIDENDADVGGLVEIGSGSHTQKVDWNILRKAINEKLAVDFRVNEDKLMGPFFLSKSVFAYDTETRQMINPDAFKKAFKSKVLMYLYEDAAKPCRHQLFSGCNSSRYSSVCDAFDRTGLEIFGNDFQALYDRTQGE